MKKMYCNYNPNDNRFYFSSKTQYGIVYPDKCEMILDHENLFNYIKENQNKYCYVLPFMVAHAFEKRLEENK